MLAEWKSEVCDVDGDAGYAAGTWVMTCGGILGRRDHHIMNGVKKADDGMVERSTATERGTCLVSTICSCALLHTWGGSLKDIGCVGVKSSKGGSRVAEYVYSVSEPSRCSRDEKGRNLLCCGW